MKKWYYLLVVYSLISIATVGCSKVNDVPSSTEIQDFIWKGLNTYYLWKDNVPNLHDSKNDNNSSYNQFLNSYSEPDALFESLLYDRQNTDKWSWIVDDYIALENSFQGISTSNGVKYRLAYETGSSTDLFGYVRYILPNSDASGKDVKRGYVFDAINGTQLTVSNYQNLLSQNTYTMNFADLNGGNPISNGKSVELVKSAYQENPIYIAKTFNIGGKIIGYLMYNSFNSSFDQQLNAAFAQLKAEGATELILDLRYNGGGSVRTATYLAGMITGQFNGQLFTKEKWNTDLQLWFETYHPDWLINNFTNELVKTNSNGNVVSQETLTNLNLTNLYVITTGSSASASELVINGLNPYINVVTIGTKTTGKYVASVTLYDSENFGRAGANPNHTWAMQPIVLEEINALGLNDKDGFDPTAEIIEYVSDFQELGLETEPLLARAIAYITNGSKPSSSKKSVLNLKDFNEITSLSQFENEMYVEKELPYDLVKRHEQ